jgi:steroid 5-alpha reductase family enzyme
MSAIIVTILVLIHVFFAIAWKTQRLAVMDIAWGLGFVLIALVGYLQNYPTTPKAILLVMIALWGLRLALYIFRRSQGKPDDPRYVEMREQWGDKWVLESYKKVFLTQAAAMFIISLPVQLGMSADLESFGIKQMIALAIWIAAFALEVWSDWHLERFRSNLANRGKACMDGPWRFVRYPNYLGEITMWWAVYLYIFGFWTSWTIIGPLAITYAIVKVTGIPLQEKSNIKKPGYAEYAARVPRLLPFLSPRVPHA